jgi:protein TonB
MNARKSAAIGLSLTLHLGLLAAVILLGQHSARTAAPGPDKVIDVIDIKELVPRQSVVVEPKEKKEAPPPSAVPAPPISLPRQFSSTVSTQASQAAEPGLTEEAPTDGPAGGMALPSGSPPPPSPEAEPVYVAQFQITDVPVLPVKEIRSRIVYPTLAAKQGIEATVYLELFIDQAGTIRRATVIRDPGHGFAEAAIAALSGLKCSPAKIEGRNVAVRFRYPVRFTLK